jgi:Cu/Zn superoxide dismutase
MRRTTCTVLALAFAAVGALGCGSDDDDTASGGAGTGASGSGASGNGGSGATGASGSGAAGASGGSGGEASGGAGGGSASGGAGGAGGGGDADAQADIMGTMNNNITGTATFTVNGDQVTLSVTMSGVDEDGNHGFHIHENGDCGDMGNAAGTHWNPEGNPHGAFDDGGHLGDVGNIAISGGAGTLSVSTELWTVGGGGETDVIGRAVMLHADEDSQQPDANPGGRIACGVIQAAN